MRACCTYSFGMTNAAAIELEQAIGQLLLRRNRARFYDAIVSNAPPAVTRQTYPVLSGLARLGPQPATRLADVIGLDRSGTSRYADRLVEAGLVARNPDPADRRALLLSLTPAGEQVIATLRAALTAQLAEQIAQWPAGQVESLISGLRLLVERVD
jgi:DNA-binding MarR family transcriptional regulator